MGSQPGADAGSWGCTASACTKPQFQKLEQQGVVRRIGPNAAILEDLRQYDAQMGLLMEYTGGEALFM